MVFVGDSNPPTGEWPVSPFTVVEQTPAMREKPYLIFDNGTYFVQVPDLQTNTQGMSITSSPVRGLNINTFFIAKPGNTAAEINSALAAGFHLILAPGIYHLEATITVNHEDTVVLGLGMATLISDGGFSAMFIDDVDGVSVSGLIFDAGPGQTEPLLQLGRAKDASHSSNPTVLYDIACRVGGAIAGSIQTCVVINSNNVIMDNIWIWRADHGKPGTVGWDINPSDTGLLVNGDQVIAYGLFVEHHQNFQTIWNGNFGQVYFYQSEIPYDVPDQKSWQQVFNPEKGYPSYKVGSNVTDHTAMGLGVYCNFNNKVELDNAISVPEVPGVKMKNMVTFWLNGALGSSINHVINGRGAAVPTPKATLGTVNFGEEE
jgi:hypothetical protein